MPSVADTSALPRATELFRQGARDEALALLEEARARALEQAGEQSFLALRATTDLASLLWVAGEDDRAAELLEAVTLTPRADPDEEKLRLTALINLAEVQERRGDLVFAEDACRRGVQGRERLYGIQHPGYAFGLVPLAQVLLRRNKAEGAAEAIAEAVANFRHHGHPWWAASIALQAEIQAALGQSLLPEASGWSADEAEGVAREVLERIPAADPRHGSKMALAIADLLETHRGASHALVREALTLLANLEATGGDLTLRGAALARLRDACEGAGAVREALQARIGLALCSIEAGDDVTARTILQDARARAATLDDEARAWVQQAEGYLGATPTSPSPRGEWLEEAKRALVERVHARAPRELLAEVDVRFDEAAGSLAVEVALLREPSESERAAVERAIAEARREVFVALSALAAPR